MSKPCCITTCDNKYSPFTEFKEWLHFDNDYHYNTLGILGLELHLSDALSDAENDEENERAIDQIIADDPFGLYVKVYESDYPGFKTTPSPILSCANIDED